MNDHGQLTALRWTATAGRQRMPYQAPNAPSRVISFDTTEGTFMNVDMSPDGKTLTFDLLGDIYQLPSKGGEAVSLTRGRAWDQAPRFSPDGKYVYFVSDREDFKNIWRLTLADQSLEQITQGDSHVLGAPNWSQDGSYLLVGVGDPRTLNTEVTPYAVDPNTGKMTPLDAVIGPWFDLDTFEVHRPATKIFSAVGSLDGDVFFSQAKRDQELRHSTVRLSKLDVKARTHTIVTPPDARFSDYKPQLSHDGNIVAYFRQYNDRRTEVRIRNRMTAQDKALIALTNVDDASYSPSDDSRPNYAFTPDDEHLIFWHAGKIHRVNITDGTRELVPFRAKVEREIWERAKPDSKRASKASGVNILRWPTLSHDGRTLAFAAIGHVWVMNITTGRMERLTGSSDFAYMPALSPDGRFVAYVSFTESVEGTWTDRLMVADIGSGTSRQVLASPKEVYLLPQWSQDGQRIALIKEVDNESGVKATFGWTLATKGVFHEVADAPASSQPSSWFIYARFAGFDEAGRNLLFSFPRSRTETVLAMARLDGSGQKTLAVGTSEVAGITAASDLNNLALTRQDGSVWIVPFEAGLEQHYVSTMSPGSQRVSAGAGYYVNWNGQNQITFGFGHNIYRQELDRSEQDCLRVNMAVAEPAAAQLVAFTGGRLITLSGDNGAGPVFESGTVLVKGDRIIAIGGKDEIAIPSDTIVIDVTGRTIMPGLIDVHYHSIGGGNLSALKLPNPTFSDDSAIVYGVTAAWEPGGAPNDGAPAMVDLQRAGRILGPRWSHSAAGSVGYPWEQLSTYSKALAAVEQHRDLGVSVLKEYNTPTREQQQWLSAAAHQLSLGIVSHIQTFDGMMSRIVDGYSGGDHPYIPVPFFKDVHELLRQTGYIWTPNIVISSGSLGGYQVVERYFWQNLLEKSPRVYNRLKDRTISDTTSLGDTALQQSVPYEIHRASRVAEQVASAAKSGVRIGISAHNMPGLGLHQEMWFLWRGGLTNDDVLRAATRANAEKLGLHEEIGSLEPGKIADFLVLDENPLDDILNTLTLRYTVQGGVVYDSNTARRADLIAIQEQTSGT
jgi:Tol biopolymer transport system component